MNATRANLINSLTLIVISIWGYFVVNSNSNEWEWTPLIPTVFGILLLLCNKGVRAQNKIIAHISVFLTLVTVIALYVKPLKSALADDDSMGILRVSIMLLTGLFAMIMFVKSFIEARRKKD